MRLTRFQSSALALRPNTGWTRPTIGGRVKGAFMGVKRRAKNFLARPGIKGAMNRVGRGLGTGVGWARQKTGFSANSDTVYFASTISKLKRSTLRPKIRRRKRLLRRLGIAGAVGAVGTLGLAHYLSPMQKAARMVKQAKKARNSQNYSSSQNLTEFRRRNPTTDRKSVV